LILGATFASAAGSSALLNRVPRAQSRKGVSECLMDLSNDPAGLKLHYFDISMVLHDCLLLAYPDPDSSKARQDTPTQRTRKCRVLMHIAQV